MYAIRSYYATGSIDNWRMVPRASAYTIEEQLGWDELPAELDPEQLRTDGPGVPAGGPEKCS